MDEKILDWLIFMVLYGMHRYLVLLLFSMAFSGCGVFDLLSSNKDSDGSFRYFDNPSDLQTSFETSFTTCNPGDCPSFVAGLYAITFDELGRRGMSACSATLISANRILTNSHCVPADLHRVGASCRDRIRFSFPNTAHYRSESVMCGQVVAISVNTSRSDEPDWAILEMVRASPRQPVVWNPGEVEGNKRMKVYKFDFDLDSRVTGEGVLKPTACRANNNFFKNNNSIGPSGPLVDISHCTEKLIHGNSGSGLLNTSNELIGVLSSALFVEDSQEEWAKTLRSFYPLLEQTSGGGTNLACIDYFNSSPLSEMCYFSSPPLHGSLAGAVQKDREQRAHTESYSAGLERIREVYALPVNSKKMQWTEDVEALTHNLNISFQGQGREQVLALYGQIFTSRYPMFPECVPDIHPETFESHLLSLAPTVREVNPTTFLATRDSEIDEKLYLFERVSESTFQVQAEDGHLLPLTIEEALGVQQAVSIHLPVCP